MTCFAAADDAEICPVNPGFKRAVYGIEKIITMILRVKSNEVASEHSFQDFFLPWANSEGLRIGPGDMPEDRHFYIGPFVLDQFGEQGKVIILNEYHGRGI